MKLKLNIAGADYELDTGEVVNLSIPLDFYGEQPKAFGAPAATARAFESGGFVGDTRRGGSCNVQTYTLIPHCNGTHTECVGHIALERISLHAVLKNPFIPCTLITVQPVTATECDDTYKPPKQDDDRLITRAALERALAVADRDFLTGLIVRTLPNSPEKKSRNHMTKPPPYFSVEAMRLIVKLGVQHLLVDLPSVDRLFDEGLLTAHHIFWGVAEGSHDVDPNNCSDNTITEMIYVANEIEDGNYLVNLQIPNFVADAAASRVWLYEVEELVGEPRNRAT